MTQGNTQRQHEKCASYEDYRECASEPKLTCGQIYSVHIVLNIIIIHFSLEMCLQFPYTAYIVTY